MEVDDGGVAKVDAGAGHGDVGDTVGFEEPGAAAAGARGAACGSDGAREGVLGDGAGVDAGADVCCLGGLPRFGLVAAGVSAATAAGWQFSQWWRSTMSSPLAILPVTTSRTDLPTLRRMGKGPSLIVSKEWLMLDLPLLT